MLSRPELHGTIGAVSSTHWLASSVGTSLYDRGGNAFDAAVAAAFVLQVVEPHMNGPGGDVPILLYDAATRQVKVVCGQGSMPAAATIGAIRRLGLDAIPGSGLIPACVPGAFGAWMTVLRQYGRLGVADVLAPAIDYAERGFPLLPPAAAMIHRLAPMFRQHWVSSAAVYLPDGRPPAPGTRLRNPDLARTYRRIIAETTSVTGRELQVDRAVRAFYEGFVAEAVDRFTTGAEVLDLTGRPNRGLLTGADLAAWRPAVEDPVTLPYRGYLVDKPGPWSQGPVFLQHLAMLSGFDLRAMEFAGADHIHTVVESAKLAFADREAWYGDPDYADVPLAGLLDADYAAARRALIEPQASVELRPGRPDGREPRRREGLADGLPAMVRARDDTTTVSATDREGNMVVATPGGGWLSGSPVVPGLGFPLGTRGQMMSLAERDPNRLTPGKRPRVTLTPTIVRTDDGRPYLAFGTPGGDRQDQWTLNFFLGTVDFGMSAQEAIEALTFHTDHLRTSSGTCSVAIEEDVAADVVAELRRRGHLVELAPSRSLGQICATGPNKTRGVLAAASPRGQQAYAMAR